MSTGYSLNLFASHSYLYSVAEKCNSKEMGGNGDNELNGEEIKMFENELATVEPNFDWNKINDENYLKNLNGELKLEIADARDRAKLIEKKTQKGEYTFTKCVKDGIPSYIIKVNKDINCSEVSEDLNLPPGAIAKRNSGYGHYDYNGHYIGNKPMQNEEFLIDEVDLNATSNKKFLRDLWHYIFN